MTIERTMAGHRVLRLLARGDRSRVWLGAGDLALKELTRPVAHDRPGHEAEALHRARGDHVIELLDLSLGPSGVVLVFPRMPRGSLAGLLRRRASLHAGEAVTILAPLAACVGRMHAAGVANAAIAAGAVLFRGDGAPMLTGFGAAQLFEPGLAEIALERLPGVAADRAALLMLADAVLARTAGPRGDVAARLREGLRDTPPDQVTDRLTRDLFALAAAQPVRFEPDAVDARPEPGRVVEVAGPMPLEAPHPRSAPGPARFAGRLLESGPGAIVREAVGRTWEGWSARRRRAVLGAGAAGVAVIIAIAVVPSSQPGVTEYPLPAVPSPSQLWGGGDASDDDVIRGDDPLAALEELAASRERCFRDLSVLCLDGVDEAGSAALEADRAALQALLDGGEAPLMLDVTSSTLVERLGDSALVELAPGSEPASVLLLKGEAGWRIRDYLAPPGAVETDG